LIKIEPGKRTRLLQYLGDHGPNNNLAGEWQEVDQSLTFPVSLN
jgi:hypothetical protein